MKSWWRSPVVWVIVAVSLFFSFYTLVLVFRHLNYYTAHYDLGNMEQVMWQSLHGHWFSMVDAGSGELLSRFTYHADVLLLIYLPFYLIAQSPLTLTIVQLVLLASAVFPLFWFARKMLPEWVAAICAIGYLIYPPLIWNLLFDVHAVKLVIPLMIWAAWAITAKRWWIYVLCVALLPLAKEEVGVTVALFGALVTWKIRPRWIGIATAVYGLAISGLMLFILIPHFRHSADHFFLQQYSAYGTTTIGVMKGILLHPISVLHTMFDAGGRSYLLHMIGPFAGLPILAIPYVFVALPEYVVNTLSSFDGMKTIVFQYTSVLTPIFVLASALGLARWWKWTTSHPALQRLGVVAVGVSSLFFAWHDAPLPGARHSEVMNVFRASPYRKDIAAIKKMVQPDDALAVTNTLGPQFTHRNKVWGFPNALDRAEGVVAMFDSKDMSPPTIAARQALQQLTDDPHWAVVLHHDNLTYLRRVSKE